MPSGSKGYAHETEKGKTRPPCKSRLLRPSGFGEPPTPNNPGKLRYTTSAVTLDSQVYPARQLPWRAPLFGENSEPQDQRLLRKHALPAAQIAAKNILYQHQYPQRRHFPEVLVPQLLARAFATYHDLVPQGIGAPPEPGCEAPPNQFGGLRTLPRALRILTVSDCLFSSSKL